MSNNCSAWPDWLRSYTITSTPYELLYDICDDCGECVLIGEPHECQAPGTRTGQSNETVVYEQS